MDIEKVAEETPEKILKVWIDPATGLVDYQTRELAFGLGLEGSLFAILARWFMAYTLPLRGGTLPRRDQSARGHGQR